MTAYRSPGTLIRRVWFTGQTIHSVAASRTAITTGPGIGAILIRDPFGHDNGDRSTQGIVGNPSPAGTGTAEADPLVREGMDYTRPQTGYLHMQKVVVVGLGSAPENGTGRWLDVVAAEESVGVLVNGAVAEGDYIVPVAGQYHGVAQATRSDTVANAVTDLNAVLRNTIGIALQDNASGTNVRAVKLGGPFNSSPDRI